MSYQPFLIANYATGVNTRLQPWLIPDDAQEALYDGFVYRGVLGKRDGYNYFATGEHNGQPYTESRIVNNISAVPMTGDIDSANKTYTITGIAPLRRGTFVVTSSNPSQVLTDDGVGGFTGPGTGTIDYIAGTVSVTFTAAPTSGTVTATYDYFPNLPVMMIANFVTSSNIKELIVADTKYLNIYDRTNNILRNLAAVYTITGITKANPGVVTVSTTHNLQTGDKVFIYGVQGMTEVNNMEFSIIVPDAVMHPDQFTIGDTSGNTAYTSGGKAELIWQGSTTPFPDDFFSWVNYPDKDGNPRLLFTNNKGQIGYYAPHLNPSVGDYVNYPTAASPDFHMVADDTTAITTICASQLAVFQDRLIMLRTTENGIVKPQRLRISGTGAKCDDFQTSATGAGKIDIADPTWIFGSTPSRNDLLIFTEGASWILKYSGNDTAPFVIDRIDASRGSQATFGAITYLNRSSALSPRGLIITDGYTVERQDEIIPDFSYNQIDGDAFSLCFAGSVDADRDHYLIYPTFEATESKRILTTNYDEDNYSIYRLPLSCMGTYVSQFTIDWNDLLVYENWPQFAAAYGNWNNFSYSKGAPFSLGGGHHGEIWQLNVTEEEDNPVLIRNIQVVDSTTIQVTTDWNNFSDHTDDDPEMGSDYIFLTGIEGILDFNDQQYPIVVGSVIDNYNFNLKVGDTSSLASYTPNTGTATRVIPFNALFKKFNPYVANDKKVRCGWLYMYVDSSGTRLKRNIKVAAATKANPCVITTKTAHNLNTGDQISLFALGGMTQLNGQVAFITVLSTTTFSLNGVNSSGYGVYTSGGYVAVAEPAKMSIDIITNDVEHETRLNVGGQNPYQGSVTNLAFEDGAKKWYKVFINQTGRFIQFRLRNTQAGANIRVQATMPGFCPVGRLI